MNNVEVIDMNNKERILNLKHMWLIKWESDTTIIPWDSSHFAVYDETYNVIPLKDQPLYKQDHLGLWELDETGWLSLITIPHNHMNFNKAILDEYVIPLLID